MSDEKRRAMEFIAAVNRAGYRPTGREINEWRTQPDPKPQRPGKLLEAEVPAVPDRRVRKGGSWSPYGGLLSNLIGNMPKIDSSVLQAFMTANRVFADSTVSDALRSVQLGGALRSMQLAGLLEGEYEVVPGKPGRPAVFAPDKPPEKFLAHLRRLNWIERDDRGRYGVTLLGHALLRAEVSNDDAADSSSVMVLEAQDELAYGQVFGVIATCGDAFIMDGYLGTQELMRILKHTSASRFLISTKLSKSRVTELAILIELTPVESGSASRELRRADFHDRWLIGEDDVYGLGSSLNGVGKSTTTLVQMPDEAARMIRANAEELWDSAEVVAQTKVDDPVLELVDGDLGDVAEDNTVWEDDGAFHHDGCTIRHRTKQAAERCNKGS